MRMSASLIKYLYMERKKSVLRKPSQKPYIELFDFQKNYQTTLRWTYLFP